MGVKGLWQLLLPTGRRISIETLTGKTLAIDASIWLIQFMKVNANRDRENEAGNYSYSSPSNTSTITPLIGFFRRICKLLFHGIRPIFVFDGATPEIKLREIRARRERREKMHSFASEGGDGGGGAGAGDDSEAVKRLAKRLLVSNLKKFKESKLLLSKSHGKKKGGMALGMTNGSMGKEDVDNEQNNSTNDSGGGGAFATGFQLPGDEGQDQDTNADTNADTNTNTNSDIDPFTTTGIENNINDVISETKDFLANHYLTDAKNAIPVQNDWDDAILSETNDNDNDDDESNESIEIPQNENDINTDVLASLPSKTRVEVIEKAKRQQRMQSRKEFMVVAANPDSYSQCQIRNFLKSATLSKKIHSVGQTSPSKKNASSRIDNGIGNEDDDFEMGERIASDTTRRFIFTKDSDMNDSTTPTNATPTNANARTTNGNHDSHVNNKRKSTTHDHSFVHSNDTLNVSSNVSLSSHQKKRRRLIKMSTSCNGNTSDDSEDFDVDGGGGGGFFKSDDDDDDDDNDDNTKKKNSNSAVGTLQTENYFDESDDSDEGGGGGFVQSDDSIGEGGGGGFIQSNDSDDGGGGGFVQSDDNNVGAFKNDAHSHESEDSNNEVGGGGFIKSNDTNDIITIESHSDDGDETKNIITIESDSDSDDDKEEGEDNEGEGLFLQQKQHQKKRIAPQRIDTTAKEESNDIMMIQPNKDGISNEDGEKGNFIMGEQLQRQKESSREVEVSANKESHIHRHKSDSDMQKMMNHNKLITINTSEEESLDDVDWEDCESESLNVQYDEARIEEIKVVNSEVNDTNIMEKDHKEQEVNTIEKNNLENLEDGSIEDVEWEDGETDNHSGYDKSDNEGWNSKNEVQSIDGLDKFHKHASFSSSLPYERIENEDIDNIEEAVEVMRSAKDANTLALKKARSTAANLTDWAGRAVQRAISAHLNESMGAQMAETETAVNSDDEDSSSNDSVGNEDIDSNNSNSNLGSDTVTQHVTQEENNVSLPKRPFIDTSLNALRDEELKMKEDANRRERDMDTITDDMIEEIIQLLHLFGIPYLKAPTEAEAQCVALEKLGLVDGVVTEDSDALVFGSKCVYKNIFDDKKYVEVYLSSDAEKLGLGMNEKIALAMLLGGDYTEGVKGVGIVNGMEILQAFPVREGVKEGLSGFRKWLDGNDFLEGDKDLTNPKERYFHKKHKSARLRWTVPKDFPSNKVFQAYSHPVVDNSKDKFTFGVPDHENIRSFCLRKIGWEAMEVDRALLPVLEKLNSGSRQTRLDGYFMRYEDNHIVSHHIKSKRLREVFESSKE